MRETRIVTPQLEYGKYRFEQYREARVDEGVVIAPPDCVDPVLHHLARSARRFDREARQHVKDAAKADRDGVGEVADRLRAKARSKRTMAERFARAVHEARRG
jgi:rubrerythrin